MPPIAMEPHEWEELRAILRTHVPNCAVWAFGSRATRQRLRRYSDLDLAIRETGAGGGLETLREALDESRLPFKVDVVSLDSLTPEFRARIEPDLVLVQG
ncbi:MAG: nucleotidyltransferase family protein [Acidobacteriota bacterium]